MQLLQVGHLPSRHDVWGRPEDRRVRVRLRLPVISPAAEVLVQMQDQLAQIARYAERILSGQRR